MKEQLLSPSVLWKTYSPESIPQEINVVSMVTDDTKTVKHLYITGILDESNDNIRISISMQYPRNAETSPCVMYIGGFAEKNTSTFVDMCVEAGYAVCTFDYLGLDRRNLPASKFSAGYSYATHPKCLAELTKATPTVEYSPWFLWSKLARRVYCYLQSDKKISDKIMVVGESEGTLMAWHLASMEDSVTALCTLGGYYPESIAVLQGRSPLTPDNERWVSGLLPESYAQFLRCPILTLLATNSHSANVDMLNRICPNIEDDVLSYEVITPFSEGEFSARSLTTFMRFADCYLKGDVLLPQPPELHVSDAVGGKLCSVTVSEKPISIMLYYAHGLSEHEYRSWTPQVVPVRENSGVFETLVRTGYLADVLHVFANVYYGDYVLSTPMYYAKLATPLVKPGFSRILYEGRNGTDTFVSRTNELFARVDAVKMSKGAMNISGITSATGDLISFKINDTRFCPSDDSLLQIDTFTMVEKKVKITFFREEGSDIVPYTIERIIKPTSTWYKLTVKREDFKTSSFKSLPGWTRLVKMSITQADGVLFNNMIWL